MNDLKLGQLITGPTQHGIVHIPASPVVAAMNLYPGELVKFINGSNKVKATTHEKPIGIIDPFLTEQVKEGEACWMLLLSDPTSVKQ